MKIRYVFFIALLAMACHAAAQPDPCRLVFSGRITDENGQALPGASVRIHELDRGVIANDRGYYMIDHLCAGSYTLRIHFIGRADVEQVFRISQDLSRNFTLQASSSELRNIEITASKLRERSTLMHTELRGVDLEQTRGQSLGDALKKIPGVSTLQTGPTISKPVIQGMHSNRILILNNGIRQEGQQWGSEHAPEIDPFIANRLTVIKGANSVRYGSDAIGGVILVEPGPLMDTAGIKGELNLVGISNGRQGVVSGILEGNFRKIPPLSWRMQGTLRRSGSIRTPDYFLKNTGMQEANFSTSVGYHKQAYGIEMFYSQFNTKIGVFTGSHIGNITDLEQAIAGDRPKAEFNTGFSYKIDRPYQQVEHELFKAKGFIRTGSGSRLNLVYARQYNLRNEFDKDKPLNDQLAALNRPELHYVITSHLLELNWEHTINEEISGMIGASGMYQKNTFQGRQFIPNFENYTGGLYWIERMVKKRFEWELGLRYDHKFLQIYKYDKGNILTPTHTFQNVSGNFGVEYKATADIHYHLNIGTAFRSPAVNELYANGLHHGAAQVLIGNVNLRPENAYVAIAGIEVSPEKKLSGQLDVYYKVVDDYIYLQAQLPPMLTIRGAFPAFAYRQTNAVFYGMDAAVNYQFNPRLNSFTRINMVRAYETSSGGYLPLIPSDRFENGLKWKGEKTGPFLQPEFSFSALNVLKQTRMNRAEDYKDAPDAYMLFNFDVSSSFRFAGQNFDAGFSVNNIMNTKYREYMDAFRYFNDEPGRSFTLRLKYHINH